MTIATAQPVLYVGREAESAKAQELLKGAGLAFSVRNVPSTSYYGVAFGTPVLFAMSNRFEGLAGVRAFLENARILGYHGS